jgi:hypothetical protein
MQTVSQHVGTLRFAHPTLASPLQTANQCQKRYRKLFVCVKNEGYAASLEKRKLYVALRDPAAEKHGLVRIVDESGDDYLYPRIFFRSIALTQSVKKAVLAA